MTQRSHPFHATLRNALMAALWAGLGTAVIAQTPMPPATGEPPTATEPSATGRVALEAAYTRADTNGDGTLTREEAVRLPALTARFDELDKNKGGVLSLQEFATGAMADVK